VEAEGGGKKDGLQVNHISGMGPNSNSEPGSHERHYKSGISNFPHVIASIYHINFVLFIQTMISSIK